MSASTMNAPILSRQVRLRHRAPGYLRFDLPAALCTAAGARHLESILRRTEGIYRVDLRRRARKLSVRYFEAGCDVATIARRMHTAIETLPAAPPCCAAHTEPGQRSWLQEKAVEIRETAQALRILGGRALRQKWLGELVHDTVVLYLIRIHWHLITQHWLVNPWRYRYELGTAFYLLYLFMRSRTPLALQSPKK